MQEVAYSCPRVPWGLFRFHEKVSLGPQQGINQISISTQRSVFCNTLEQSDVLSKVVSNIFESNR